MFHKFKAIVSTSLLELRRVTLISSLRDTIWFTTAAQEAALTNYIRNTILPQLSLGGKTTYQKVQAIYNWITANVKYDYSHLNDPAYWLQYTAYAAAVQKKAVCQGYANLFYRLANDACKLYQQCACTGERGSNCI